MARNNNVFSIQNKADDVVEITIEGYIGSWWKENPDAIITKEEMQQQLKQVAEIKAKNIIVYINSYGGDVNHGVSIHDLLANNDASVTTIINGHTASAATIIAMAADKGKRKISANALALIHDASIWAGGNKHDLQVSLSDLNKMDETIASIYSKRCGKTVDEVKEMMDRFSGRGEWLTASEAKEWGLVDEIYEPSRMAAAIDVEVINAFGLPEIPAEKLTAINAIEIKPKTENIMKKFLLTSMAFIAAFFEKETKDEFEPTQDNLQKLNDKLQLQADDIVKITSERDAAQAQIVTLTAEKETFAGVKAQAEVNLQTANARITELEGNITAANTARETAEASLATATARVTELEAENAALVAGPGAESAAAKSKKEAASAADTDADLEYYKTHTIAEGIAYMQEKNKTK
jgi:ATP-dependent Clp endopeptidase proteolytic subunit ClpP